jgi:hypothetical protein
MLVKLDKEYAAEGHDEPWENRYPSRLIEHFV